MFRSTFRTRRVTLVLLILLLSLAFTLPKQRRGFLEGISKPLAQLVALPLGAFTAIDRSVKDLWEGYIALHRVSEENHLLRREIQLLRSQNHDLMEMAVSSRRLAALLELKQRMGPQTIAAQVIGRDATNWYRGIVLNKGERDGIRVEMGVVAPDGVVGRVVKTSSFSSEVLLVTDQNNAVTGLIQRTRDEGIVEGTVQGRARMKYIPLLSTVRVGDAVVTSGLTGGFPRGVPIGTIASIEKREGDLFQSAELTPALDFHKIEEVLVITSPHPMVETDAEPSQLPTELPGRKKP